MKFKRTFHVFIDNFSTTYKLLLYKLIVSVLFSCIIIGLVYPIISKVTNSAVFTDLLAGISDFFSKLVNGEAYELGNITEQIKEDLQDIVKLIQGQQTRIIVSIVILVIVYLIQKFLQGIGHYTAACLVNDKMALHANSPFIMSMIKNLGKASIYNLVYVPLSVLYELLSTFLVGWLLLYCFTFLPLLLRIYLTVVCILLLTIIKMTFTTDWLPAMICGKKGNLGAMRATFVRKGKDNKSVLSNYIIFVLIIMALNVGAVLLTLGAGLLITVPASYIILICFQFVNYCDDNEILYFADKNTIVKPDKVKQVSREDFFRGEN